MGACSSVEGIDEPVIPQQKPALCIDPDYVCHSDMLLKMKWTMSWSGDDRIIQNEETKTNILQINSKSLCWNAMINLCAMNGKIIGKLDGKSQLFGWTKFKIINARTNQIIAWIERKSTGWWHGYCNCSQQFIVHKPKKRGITYQIDGTFHNMQFVIRNKSGQIVAKSSTQFVKTGILSSSYGIQIAQGNDLTVIAAIMTAIAKYKTQERGQQQRRTARYE